MIFKREGQPDVQLKPLHSAPMGLKLGCKPEDCPVTEDLGSRTLRLPLYADMSVEDASAAIKAIENLI